MKYCYSLKINDQNFLLVLNFCLFHSKSLEVFSTLTRIQADRIWPQRQCCNRTGCPKNCNIFTPNTKKVRLCSSNKSHSLKRSSRIKRRRPFEGTMKNAKRPFLKHLFFFFAPSNEMHRRCFEFPHANSSQSFCESLRRQSSSSTAIWSPKSG